jgi:uncharacterized protein YacL
VAEYVVGVFTGFFADSLIIICQENGLMSADFITRILGMVGFSLLGAYYGGQLGSLAEQQSDLYAIIFGLLGALAGLVITPMITLRPIKMIRSKLTQISSQKLVAGQFGLLAGLILAALVTLPLSKLPEPFSLFLPSLAVFLFGYLGVYVFVMRSTDIFNLFSRSGRQGEMGLFDSASSRTIVMDTSVIIDGRITDIARTGFLSGTLLIPRFVLNELQYIADSPDSLRRQRGRRGIEVLAQLQKDPTVPVRISDIDVEGARDVDDKLVILARQLRCPILTNDYNLNRVAELQGVTVLNINELANSVKSVMLPGEPLSVKIIQEGKEPGQGVGYLDDGTMVVVEDGRALLNTEALVAVTKVLQTSAGRMIFARLNGEG